MTSPASSHSQGNAPTQSGSSSVAYTATTFDDTFWAPRLQNIRENTLFAIYEQLKQDGHFGPLQESWRTGNFPVPYVFWESDISKWIEAASYSLATHPDATLHALVDEAIQFLCALQQPDGYLNLWFTKFDPQHRWSNMRDHHELYCAGHLIEAAVAHFQATGTRTLLDLVRRYADYIDATFGSEDGKRHGYCGHEEIELALIKLYHATNEERYLHLSHYFIEERGRQHPHYFDEEALARGEQPADFWAKTYEYNQSHLPVREQHEIVGHAVRAMYLYSAVADLAHELQDESLQQLCVEVWEHLCSTQLYVTGGLGSSAENEGFTTNYNLPNATAYGETCAAIGLVLWSQRMLRLDTDRRYADVLEQALYNGVLSGLALDGTTFFYVNPLESQGKYHRKSWYKCACCPPNLARLLLSLGQYMYGVNEADILVHLYAQSTTTLTIGAQQIELRQTTNYPWDGEVHIALTLDEPAEFGIKLRIPSWCKTAHLTVAGTDVPLELQKGYVQIVRTWQTGDALDLYLDMPGERIYAHPAVRADAGCVALRRGPLVYCCENTDNSVPLHQILLPSEATLTNNFDPSLLGGVVVIKSNALALDTADRSEELYQTHPPTYHAHTLTAIPYYAWDHREPGEMRVWIRTLEPIDQKLNGNI